MSENEGGQQRLTIEEARGVMLAAQGLFATPAPRPNLDAVRATIDRLGVVQIDTISVIERSQYLVLWSRLGPYDATLLDALLNPHRAIFEYWSHAASIVPMSDYPYYRADMVRAGEYHLWDDLAAWMRENPQVIAETLEAIRTRGPLASADFEGPADGKKANPWDWYGPKESRRALDILWTTGDLMISHRLGGQKVYDLRERVLTAAFDGNMPHDDALPTPAEQARHFVQRTVRALGVLTPSWLWDYFRVRPALQLAATNGQKLAARLAAKTVLDGLVADGILLPATIEGIKEPAYLAVERLPDLQRLRAGEKPARTTLLSPFDNLIWHRSRTESLFNYEVCFEAYVVPEKRRYGYYCLAILHRGRIVGRVDAKAVRSERALLARAIYLEPGVKPDQALLSGLARALRDLVRFLKLDAVRVERSEPETLAAKLSERLERASA